MIEGYIGPPGSGKTYTLVQRTLRERAKHPNRPIFTNFPVRGCTYFEPEDWIHLPPGLIIFDEAHLLFSARAAMRLPGKWLETLSQTRKRQWDILFSTQHQQRVDAVLRDVSDLFWHCSAWGGGQGSPPLLFRARSFEPEDFRKPKKHITTQWSRFNPRTAGAYDTLGRIQVAQHLEKHSDKGVGER